MDLFRSFSPRKYFVLRQDHQDDDELGRLKDAELSSDPDNYVTDSDSQFSQPPSRLTKPPKRVLHLLCMGLVVCFALWGFLDAAHRAWLLVAHHEVHGSHEMTEHQITHASGVASANALSDDPDWHPRDFCKNSCGRSTGEALANGCEFDDLTYDFRRPECIDRDLSNEFRTHGTGPGGGWTYMTTVGDDGEKDIINATELASIIQPGRQVYVTMYWHMMFCLFKWRQQYRSIFLGTVDDMIREEAETHHHHCVSYISTYLQGLDVHHHNIMKTY
ncbi:hypothetical protein DHEL01_v212966 [Diaporthe helianthi]|uniref:Uncharacterized protein n=1 Tax=Diaporthe helianthi TaxID=158607 RepID=A0A2P5HEI3_DIAHE|nr:hypothetical protein DHEL01_v212966 [Diaporthe helianthi]